MVNEIHFKSMDIMWLYNWLHKHNLSNVYKLMGDRYYYRNRIDNEEFYSLLQVTCHNYLSLYAKVIIDYETNAKQ